MAFQSGGGGVGVDEGESGWLMQGWSIASAEGSRGEIAMVEERIGGRGIVCLARAPARYALWAICDVLPPHFPVLRFACPKFQPRSGVSGGHGRLGRAGAKRGLFIAEVAERVLFTVGTTVPPCLAKGKPARSGVCFPDRVVEWNYFTSGSTVTHLRSAQLLRPSSANWTPLAPRRRSHGKGSSTTMWRRKSSHWILKALS
jgi:hypothetical protein